MQSRHIQNTAVSRQVHTLYMMITSQKELRKLENTAAVKNETNGLNSNNRNTEVMIKS